MTQLINIKFSVKLLASFFFCAFITLTVGIVGYIGIGKLADALTKSFSEQLVAASNISEMLSGLTAHNRSLYRLYIAKLVKSPQEDLNRAAADGNVSLVGAEEAMKKLSNFPEYKNDANLRSFQAMLPDYIATSKKIMELINNESFDQAKEVMNATNAPAFRQMRDVLRTLSAANKQEVQSAAEAAQNLEHIVYRQLVIGVTLAFIIALITGLFITRMITGPLGVAIQSAQRIAQGDLTQSMSTTRKDEAGQLLNALDAMQTSLKSTLTEITQAAEQLASSAEELNAVTDDSTQGLIRQNGEIQQAATAVSQMTVAIENVASNAVSTSAASRSATEEATGGREQVERTVDGINTMLNDINESAGTVTELAKKVHDISGVLSVIRDIAEQTNLLALNAAIEAARAGEQGRGFAVVADEVRALAHRTQASTVEIEATIDAIKTDADGAVQAMDKSLGVAHSAQEKAKQAGGALERITRGVYEINERNLVIASASEEQAQVAREVDKNLVNIQSLSEQTATGANQIAASSQDLSRLAASFNTMVGKFRL